MTVMRATQRQIPLPEHILLSIFCQVDWRTLIFIIRTTCRSFHALTRTRILWVRLLRMHSQKHGIPHHFDAPLVTYSASDLERRFLVRVGADIQLSDNFKLVPSCHLHRQRHIRLRSNLRLLVSHLIEGGRWLVGLTNEGVLLSWDLDNDDVGESCQLLGDAPVWDDPNPSWDRCDVGETTSCINMVDGKPTLTFRFAVFHVSFCSKDGHESDAGCSRRRPTLCVWEISLVSSASKLELEATRLLCCDPTTLVSSKFGSFHRVALRDEHLVIHTKMEASVQEDEERGQIDRIDIYDWRELASGKVRLRSILFMNESIHSIHLLPGMQYLVISYIPAIAGRLFHMDDVPLQTVDPIAEDDLYTPLSMESDTLPFQLLCSFKGLDRTALTVHNGASSVTRVISLTLQEGLQLDYRRLKHDFCIPQSPSNTDKDSDSVSGSDSSRPEDYVVGRQHGINTTLLSKRREEVDWPLDAPSPLAFPLEVKLGRSRSLFDLQTTCAYGKVVKRLAFISYSYLATGEAEIQDQAEGNSADDEGDKSLLGHEPSNVVIRRTAWAQPETVEFESERTSLSDYFRQLDTTMFDEGTGRAVLSSYMVKGLGVGDHSGGGDGDGGVCGFMLLSVLDYSAYFRGRE